MQLVVDKGGDDLAWQVLEVRQQAERVLNLALLVPIDRESLGLRAPRVEAPIVGGEEHTDDVLWGDATRLELLQLFARHLTHGGGRVVLLACGVARGARVRARAIAAAGVGPRGTRALARSEGRHGGAVTSVDGARG